MRILMTGGTGFIGSELCHHFLQNDHTLTVLSRASAQLVSDSRIQYIHSLQQLDDSDFDVIINLAGEPIADRRWSAKQKQTILNSRLQTTEALISFMAKTSHKPTLFISGSAIGFYGLGGADSADQGVAEDALGDNSFSSQLCHQWEACALQAKALGIRTCLLRTGIVLGKQGGALSKMLLPFKLGLGGKIGSGQQWMPWIHLDDMVAIVDYCMAHEPISGPINCTAPEPVSNAAFTQTLGKCLARPTFFTVPSPVISLLLGDMGKELLLSGRRVLPEKLLRSGFHFKYRQLEDALHALIRRDQ